MNALPALAVLDCSAAKSLAGTVRNAVAKQEMIARSRLWKRNIMIVESEKK